MLLLPNGRERPATFIFVVTFPALALRCRYFCRYFFAIAPNSPAQAPVTPHYLPGFTAQTGTI
jgi:hypothetical protein